MKENLIKIKNGALISLAVLGVLSIVTTFVRYRLTKRLLKKTEDELSVSDVESN